MDLISIIVPVYKVEKYLDRCINSLINQTYKNLEIILVDDGSPDNSGAMCDEWADKDARIKVIHKENAGPGYARNSGIDAASGKYVMFVDSDDYIVDNACELAHERISKTNAQICSFGYMDDFDGKLVVTSQKPKMLEYCDEQVMDYFLADAISQSETETEIPFVLMAVWNSIYDLSVIKDNNIKFLSESFNEDLLFKIEVCKHINKVVILPQNLYCYCHNGASVSTSHRPERFEESLKLYDILQQSLAEYMDRSDIKNRCKRAFMNNIIVCLKQEVIYCKQKGIKNLVEKYLRIVNSEAAQEVIGSYPIDKLPKQQKLLFKFIKNKRATFVYLLVKANLTIKNIKHK